MNMLTERAHVYVVDGDHRARASCRELLQSLGYHTEDYADARSFLAAADCEAAGCVVLDVSLPDMRGADLHERLRIAGSPLAVVFLTTDGDIDAAVASMQRGAAGYLLKPAREQQLLDVVNQALRRSVSEAVEGRARRAVLAHLARLTPRERQVLRQLVDGVHYDVVSAELGITQRTVEAHRRRIMEKMGARTLPQLLRQLAQAGWPARHAPGR